MNFSIGIYSCPMDPIHLVGLYTTRLPVFRWKEGGYDWILVDSIGQPSASLNNLLDLYFTVWPEYERGVNPVLTHHSPTFDIATWGKYYISFYQCRFLLDWWTNSGNADFLRKDLTECSIEQHDPCGILGPSTKKEKAQCFCVQEHTYDRCCRVLHEVVSEIHFVHTYITGSK